MSSDHDSGSGSPFDMPDMPDLPEDRDEIPGMSIPHLDLSHRELAPRIEPTLEEHAKAPEEFSEGREHPEFLNDQELDVVYYIERVHATTGEAPTDAQIMERYNGITKHWLHNFATNPLVKKSMQVRGITYPAAGDILSDRQMAAIAAMLAYNDRRSDGKKLSDIGVTPREWAGWIQDEYFSRYLNERAERMMANTTFEAHLGLIKGMRNGNVASIKLRNEMTGRHNPEGENAVNVRLMLQLFIEIIQKYVTDPVTLHKIANDLTNMASRESFNGQTNRILPGTVQR